MRSYPVSFVPSDLTGAVGVELKLGCLDGSGKRVPKGQAQKFATIALRFRPPGSQPFASTSSASDVTIEDLDGHLSGCMCKSSCTGFSSTCGSNPCIQMTPCRNHKYRICQNMKSQNTNPFHYCDNDGEESRAILSIQTRAFFR